MRASIMLSVVFVVCPSLVTATFFDKTDESAADKRTPELSKELEILKPFLGTWEVNGEWAGGGKLWARNHYKIGLGGKFIEASTFAKDGDGKVYERYRTIFSFDKKKKSVVSHGFTYDGTTSVVDMKTEKNDSGRSIAISQWTPTNGTTTIKQKTEFVDDDSYRWQVWSRMSDDGDWTEIMNAVWKRAKKSP